MLSHVCLQTYWQYAIDYNTCIQANAFMIKALTRTSFLDQKDYQCISKTSYSIISPVGGLKWQISEESINSVTTEISPLFQGKKFQWNLNICINHHNVGVLICQSKSITKIFKEFWTL